jgi:hypothetical protein
MAARGAGAGRARAAHRHALETLETLENYFRAGIDLVAFVSFEPGQTKAFDKLLPLPLARE